MDGATMINTFRAYTANTSDMSEAEILSLLNTKYRKLLNGNPWEMLRKEATGVISGTSIVVPADFDEFMENWSDSESVVEPNLKVVLTNGSPYTIIPRGARNSAMGHFCYFDFSDNTVKYLSDMTGQTYSFDYKHRPADIELDTTSILPPGLDMILIYDALLDEEVIAKSDPARTSEKKNRNEYLSLLSTLRSRNKRAATIN